MTLPIPGARRGRPKLKKSERKIPIRGSLSPDAAQALLAFVDEKDTAIEGEHADEVYAFVSPIRSALNSIRRR